MSESKNNSKSSASKRGRPKKVRSKKELAIMQMKQHAKKSLAEKQEIKLKQQQDRQAKKIAAGEIEPSNKERFYCTNKQLLAELIKWRDSAEKPEDRQMSEQLGEMLLMIGKKLLNHSNFRNYSAQLKEDMLSFGIYKIIKGLKTYNFKFTNPFSYCTQCFYNAYITVVMKHYKHLNIKKDLMKKLLSELETIDGISQASSLNRCIRAYLGDEVMDCDMDE